MHNYSDVGSSIKLGGQVSSDVGGGHNLLPLFNIGLTDLPKPGRLLRPCYVLLGSK